ncbi:MAG: hypothetical protein MJ239_00595 [Bacilli bacterium]|nr:hypothetical protein [Bacilli bacterium]
MNFAMNPNLYDDSIGLLQIFLLVDIIIVFAFIIWACFVAARITDFRSKLKKRLYAISILLSEKKDIIVAMGDFFVSNGIKLSKTQEAAINCLRFLTIDELKDTDVKTVETTIKDAVGHVKFLASTNPELTKKESFVTLSDSLHDIDNNLRQGIAIYNSDLLGYSYWFKSPLTHWLFYIFGNRAKEPLN